MTAFDPDPKLRWLICAAHPDDELAIACWIGRLVAAGAEVFMSWSHATPVREAEARAVAKVLGVTQDRLFFHNGPDGHLLDVVPAFVQVFRRMMAEVKPDRVCVTAFEQGHIDHDATNYLVSRSFDGPKFEWPMYHPYTRQFPVANRFASPEGEEVLQLTPEEVRRQPVLARLYGSQTLWRNVVLYNLAHSLVGREKRLMATERLRVQGPTDFTKPNLPARLVAEVEASGLWRRWASSIAEYERLGGESA